MNKKHIYAILDDPKAWDKKCIPVRSKSHAYRLNAQGFGIFSAINSFDGPRRRQFLKKINAWYVDMDKGSKEEQLGLIQLSPLPPSLIVETKNGFHLYWFAKDATLKNFHEIVKNRLIPFFNADPNAADVCRILRIPGFLHLKDPKNPFLIKKVYKFHCFYTEQRMLSAFRQLKKQRQINRYQNQSFSDVDNIDALKKLSGAVELKSEIFTFKKNADGSQQILVNEKSTSSWIDKWGFIGSYQRGGKTWVQWVMWYGYDYQQAYKIGEKYGIKQY